MLERISDPCASEKCSMSLCSTVVALWQPKPRRVELTGSRRIKYPRMCKATESRQSIFCSVKVNLQIHHARNRRVLRAISCLENRRSLENIFEIVEGKSHNICTRSKNIAFKTKIREIVGAAALLNSGRVSNTRWARKSIVWIRIV